MKDIDVIILCGGQGTRLKRIVGDRPKPMAEIHGRPFLDILINYVSTFGLNRFILCTGYMGKYIETFYKKTANNSTFIFSNEKSPLGTGGALKNAEQMIRSDPFLVMNGDSFCPVKIDTLLDMHEQKKAIATIAVSQIDDAGDFGSITMDGQYRITAFGEKISSAYALINAGVYLMDKRILSLIPPRVQISLEKDLFPRLVGQDFYGFRTSSAVIDIGTPERYERAKRLL